MQEKTKENGLVIKSVETLQVKTGINACNRFCLAELLFCKFKQAFIYCIQYINVLYTLTTFILHEEPFCTHEIVTFCQTFIPKKD